MIEVVFGGQSGQTPTPSSIKLGVRRDHNIQQVRFSSLPVLAEGQTVHVEWTNPNNLGDDVILTDNIWNITNKETAVPGMIDVTVKVMSGTEIVWHSELLYGTVSKSTDVETLIPEQTPTSILQMQADMAAHREKMEEFWETAKGDSAYQVWLSQGNEGDEAAYLASLKGDKGDTGEAGPQGAKGDQGVQGPVGAQGIQGIQGEQGTQGVQGVKGDKGDKGDKGATGSIQGKYTNLAALNAAHPTGNEYTYLTDNGHFWTWESGAWADRGLFNSNEVIDNVLAQLAAIANYLSTPIATYTHTTNKEVVISSIDISTDTFTSVGHGLVNGNVLMTVLNNTVGAIYPKNVYQTGAGFGTSLFFVINKTTDTFQLSLANGGSAIDLVSNPNLDLSKWHFESLVGNVSIAGLPSLTKCAVRIIGRSGFQSSSSIIAPNGLTTSQYLSIGYTTYMNPFIVGLAVDIRLSLFVLIDYTNFLTIKAEGIASVGATATTNTNTLVDRVLVSPVNVSGVITSLNFNDFFFTNGTKIEVYKA